MSMALRPAVAPLPDTHMTNAPVARTAAARPRAINLTRWGDHDGALGGSAAEAEARTPLPSTHTAARRSFQYLAISRASRLGATCGGVRR